MLFIHKLQQWVTKNDFVCFSGADVNLADFKGKTPLYICVNNAVVHSCTSAIKKLLSAGAIVDKYVTTSIHTHLRMIKRKGKRY